MGGGGGGKAISNGNRRQQSTISNPQQKPDKIRPHNKPTTATTKQSRATTQTQRKETTTQHPQQQQQKSTTTLEWRAPINVTSRHANQRQGVDLHYRGDHDAGLVFVHAKPAPHVRVLHVDIPGVATVARINKLAHGARPHQKKSRQGQRDSSLRQAPNKQPLPRT